MPPCPDRPIGLNHGPNLSTPPGHARSGRSYSPVSAHPELPDPSDNGSVARFDGLPSVPGLAAPQTEDWLIATHNHDTDLRRNTMLKLSRDNEASSPHALTICPGSSAYSTAARLPDGRIGVLYERQGYRDIVFASVDPQDLLDAGSAADPAATGTVGAGLVFDLELRSITPALPELWQTVGESVTLPTAHPDISSSVWKEMGQGYSADQAQMLSNRESQDLNYGPPRPGYRAGDILAFAGRAANRGTQAMSAVELSGTFSNPEANPPTDLAPGDKALYPSLAYTVTDGDVAAGRPKPPSRCWPIPAASRPSGQRPSASTPPPATSPCPMPPLRRRRRRADGAASGVPTPSPRRAPR